MGEKSTVRADKWLWAARFFKTRSLASKAVSGGHVNINGNKIKPSRIVAIGDTFHIRKGIVELEVVVLALSSRRASATIAQTLYEETETSREKREQVRLERQLLNAQQMKPSSKPDKRERRKIRKFQRKD